MVFDRHGQAVEPPTWDIIAPPFTLITDSGEFSLKTDIGDAVERYGEGVYTITIVAKIDGALEPISQYALLMD